MRKVSVKEGWTSTGVYAEWRGRFGDEMRRPTSHAVAGLGSAARIKARKEIGHEEV
jgi:hypothetical protein